MTTPALFPKPPAPELTLSKHFAALARSKGRYAAYKPVRRVQCEECVWVLHEARGVGEPPRSARTKRTPAFGSHEADPRDVVLCNGHADLWRKREGK